MPELVLAADTEWFEGSKAEHGGLPLGCPFEDKPDIECGYPHCGCHEEDE